MIRLFTDAWPEVPALDTGISHALVRAVGDGEMAESFRLHRTGRVVAFGRQDRVSPGYQNAVQAARLGDYLPIERLAGGRAAVFHEDTLAFAWAIPDAQPRDRIAERFRSVSTLLFDSFRDLGIDASIGELRGEYCPGSYSIHAGGRKVMGVGQRLVRGAAHVGGVIVVDGGRRIARVLEPVYAALGIDWDSSTAGDLADDVSHVTIDVVMSAVTRRLGLVDDVEEGELPAAVIDAGRRLAPGHVAPAA
jgi:octanoyl-[GcvH]:protein N-octanoyltransferase